MHKIKVELRAPEGKKQDFFGASSLLSVSMGKKILLQGECLKQSIAQINQTFRSCDIVISDMLQRFNLMGEQPNLNEKTATYLAISSGDTWLENNKGILSSFTIPHRITRWFEWLKSPNYSQKYAFLLKEFSQNPAFQKTIFNSINVYFERQQKSPSKRANEFACDFILEEAAVMLLWCDEGYDFELHPSARNEALRYIHTVYYHNQQNVPKLKQARIKVLGENQDAEMVKAII